MSFSSAVIYTINPEFQQDNSHTEVSQGNVWEPVQLFVILNEN